MANTATSKGVVKWTPGTSNVPGVPGVTVSKPTPAPTPAPTPVQPPKPTTGTSTLNQSVMVNKQSPFTIQTPKPTVVKKGTGTGTGIVTGTKTGTGTTPKTGTGTGGPTGMTTPLAEKTIGEELQRQGIDYQIDPSMMTAEEKYQRHLEDRMNENIDPDQIFQNKLRQWQGYMDSLKGVYAQKVDEVRQQGMGRLGTNRAQQARGGLLGSDFGAAQTNTINANTEAQVDTVNQELQSKIQELMGQISSDSAKEAEAKREAMNKTMDDYISFIGQGQERKKARLGSAADYLLSIGITDISQVSDKDVEDIAKKIKVPKNDVSLAFNMRKAERQAEADKIARESQFNLSEGQARYDAKGNIIASRAKTYAPKDTGVTVGSSSSSLVSQPGYSKLNAKQKNQADSLNNLVRSLNEYKNTIRDTVAPSGVNLTGADAGLLETKLNSIIFAAAQAEGTGALQAADRAVIEKIIPNPTSISGAFNALTKGGKEGQINRIQDQINKYTNNLYGYGLTPVIGNTQKNYNYTYEDTTVPEVYTVNGVDYQMAEDGTYYPVN